MIGIPSGWEEVAAFELRHALKNLCQTDYRGWDYSPNSFWQHVSNHYYDWRVSPEDVH